MRSRAPSFLVAALLLLVLVLASAPASQATYVEENSFRYFPVARNQTFYAADVHPNGTPALVAGGVLAEHPTPDDQYLLRYDGTSWNVVMKRAGTYDGPLVDVAWRPQGDYALVPAAGGADAQGELRGSILACAHPCRNTSHLTELWRPGVTRLAGNATADRGFAARKADWHPGGDHALVTGSGLIRWNGTTFTSVERGQDIFYNAVRWHPSGEMALVQRGLDGIRVCLDPCDSSLQLRETGITFEDSGGSSAIEAFSFHPGWDEGHDKAYAVGVENQTSRILEITMGNRTDPTTWTTTYYNPVATDQDGDTYDAPGELTGMAWYPDGSSALVAGSLSQQVLSFPRDPAGPHDMTRLMDLDGPKLFGAHMAPGGTYTLFGSHGGFYRYDPQGVPLVEVVTPDPTPESGEEPTFVDPFAARGEATPKRDGRNVTGIEWTVAESVEGFARTDDEAWHRLDRGNWTRAGDGTVNWSMTVDPAGLQPGRYVLGVRADDGEVVGPPGLTSFRVPGPTVDFAAPDNRTEARDAVEARGNATPRVPDGEVTAVRWRVTPSASPGHPGSGGWREANLTGEDGTARWNLTWAANARDACFNTIEVRAHEGDVVGRPSHRIVYVPGCLREAPDVSVVSVDHGEDVVTIDWTAHPAAEDYTVEVGDDPGFFNATTLATLGSGTTSFRHEVGGNGTYHYRVMAANAYEETAWGTTTATVEDPPDDGGEGGTDGGTGADGSDGTDGGDGADGGQDVIGEDGTDGTDDGDGGAGDDTGTDPGGGGPADGGTGADVPGPGAAGAVAALAGAALRRRRGP